MCSQKRALKAATDDLALGNRPAEIKTLLLDTFAVDMYTADTIE